MTTAKLNKTFVLFTVAIFLFLILPWLITEGMFMDGMIYATVGKNLANGEGSWWNLHLTKYLSDTYNDQPPLTLWLTSFFFNIFGNSLYTERIYSFVMAVFNLLLIRSIWKKVYYENKSKAELWWLPVLLWILPPACFWSFANNMEENTMSVFILLAVNAYLSYELFGQKLKHLLSCSAFIFMAGMTKGIQGTFILAAPLFSLLLFRKTTVAETFRQTSILVSCLVAGSLLLFLYEPSRIYFEEYYRKRILNTFANPESSTTPTRLYLLFRLSQEMILPVVLILLIRFLSNKLKSSVQISKEEKQRGLWFLFIALAGTLPLMITSEQRRFYLVPAYPYYALLLSILVINNIQYLIRLLAEKIRSNNLTKIAWLAIISTLIFTATQIGKVKRDVEMIHDVKKIGALVPQGSIIYLTPALTEDWSLQLYMKRYTNIDLSPSESKDRNFYFLDLQSNPKKESPEEMLPGLQAYHLYYIKL